MRIQKFSLTKSLAIKMLFRLGSRMNTIPKPQDQKAVIALLKENDLPFKDLDFNRYKFRLKMESDESIAVCAVEEFGKYGLLRSLSVRKGFQGKGIGKSLCEEVLCCCRNE
jgi:N-acetylglutamate synthase-like GNAT family acetyltransferase